MTEKTKAKPKSVSREEVEEVSRWLLRSSTLSFDTSLLLLFPSVEREFGQERMKRVKIEPTSDGVCCSPLTDAGLGEPRLGTNPSCCSDSIGLVFVPYISSW